MDPIDAGRLREDLERLVRIPSIAFDGHPREPLDEAAALVRELLPGSRFVDVPGEAPSVYAEYGSGEPTVLLYAHYDVQPAPTDGWDTDPFTPTVPRRAPVRPRRRRRQVRHRRPPRRPARVRLRPAGPREGADRGLRGERAPDASSRSSTRDPDLMRADVMVIADGGNWKLGEPTLCTTLRGHGKLTVTLRTLENALHSGHVRRRRAGRAARAHPAARESARRRRRPSPSKGCTTATWDGADLPEADFRRQAGVLDGVAADRGGQRRRPPVGAARDLRPRPRRARRRGRRQHRHPGRARQGRRARPAGRRPAGLDGRRRAPPARAHAVGRAARARGRARVDARSRCQRRRRRRAGAGGRRTASPSR